MAVLGVDSKEVGKRDRLEILFWRTAFGLSFCVGSTFEIRLSLSVKLKSGASFVRVFVILKIE